MNEDNKNDQPKILSETGRVRIEKTSDDGKLYAMKHRPNRKSNLNDIWKQYYKKGTEPTGHEWKQSAKASNAFTEELDIINDKLCRINIYFIKATEEDPNTKVWADAETIAHIEEY